MPLSHHICLVDRKITFGSEPFSHYRFRYDPHAGTPGNYVGLHNYLGRRTIHVSSLDRVE